MDFDLKGVVFNRARKYRLNILMVFATYWMRTELWLRGVQILERASFWGRCKFVRYPNSIIKIGKKCSFRSDRSSNLAGVYMPCTISTLRRGAEIVIGDECGFSGVVIGAVSSILVGDRVMVGVNSFISDSDWHNVDPCHRTKKNKSGKAVVIEDDVWIGGNVIVLKGVRIGEKSVIGANSVVVRDIPANVVAAGNPCKVVRTL